MTDQQRVGVERAEQGQWVSFDDAVGMLGMSERLVERLVSEGKLRSRQNADDSVDIWVTDADRVDEAPKRSLEIIHRDQPLLSMERLSSAMSRQVASLTAPLAASYERNVELARENGILSERLASLERELQALRESMATELQALDQARRRLEAMEGANVALTRMLAAAQRDEPRRRRWPWLLLIAALVFVLAIAAFALLLPGYLPRTGR